MALKFSFLFQFLIGSLESLTCKGFQICKVQFQFLIGSLESNRIIRDRDSNSQFQFLIGSLESWQCTSNCSVSLLFQFLIGSLESVGRKNIRRTNRLVSIPYRQSRIIVATEGLINFLTSFNSLQVVQNLEMLKKQRKKVEAFQFLIGSLESLPYLFQLLFYLQVSIPYRQSRISKTFITIENVILVSIPYRQSRIQLYTLILLLSLILI